MIMAVSEVPLKIHVAKAKDLPLSWYELVLRPDKFAEHLKVLQGNRKGKPPKLIIIIIGGTVEPSFVDFLRGPL